MLVEVCFRVAGVRDQETLLVGPDRLELDRLERLPHAAGQEEQHEPRGQVLLDVGHAVRPAEDHVDAAEARAKPTSAQSP